MARKRTRDDEHEQDEEDFNRAGEEEDFEDEQDDEEEEEEEQEDIRPAKRKFNPFIDEMAIVDDEEEEEEDEGEEYSKEDVFIEEETDLPSAAAMQRRHRDLERQRREVEEMDDEQLAAIYAEKYGGRKGHTFEASEEVPQQLLLPSGRDPNLWMVKCKMGKERDVIFSLMTRYFRLQYHDNPLEIFSAFARESLKGYIYIECRRQDHVQQAIRDIPFIFASTLALVPMKDMVDTITIRNNTTEIPIRSWVRVKRGKYAGDLGQVMELTDTDDRARIKLLPRLDIYKSSEEDQRKPGGKGSTRPPQKLFDPERLGSRQLAGLQKKGRYWVFGGEHFRDGYLEKWMNVTMLQIDNVNPALDEVTKFAGGDDLNTEDGESAIDLSSISAQALSDAQSSSVFQFGDFVQVTEGDLIHAMGTVIDVKDTSVSLSLDLDGLQKTVTLPSKQIRKSFKVGDHVKATHGRYKDETGMVVAMKDDIAVILTDASLKEIKVFSKDLRMATEVGQGVMAIGNYELHDLVQLDAHTVGVIVKVDRDSFKVLVNDGQIRTVEPHHITHKRDSKRAVTNDSRGNSIRSGDVVYESNSSRPCTILHVYRHLVFLFSREEPSNFGVWISNARRVVSATANSQSNLSSGQNSHGPPGRGRFDPRGRGRGGRDGSFGGRGRGGRDQLIAKTVRVSQGPHKGYLGIVKDTTDMMARVELHTNSKVISVDKSKLVLVDAKGNSIGPAIESAAPFANARENAIPPSTPRRYGDGGMTPMYNAPGAKTPAWNSGAKTPSLYGSDGSKTPAWDLGSKTPNPYAHNDGSRTPAWDSGSKTPMWHTETPRWESGSSARTPAFDAGSKTPTWSGRYDGDDNVAPTPAAQPMVPATPAATYGHTAPSPAYPQTPAAHIPQTPFDSAPTPGASLIPATPSAFGAPTPMGHLSAPTPGTYPPATPAASFPQTPYMPGDAEGDADELGNVDDWPIEDIEVKVIRTHGKAATGQLGSVVSVNTNARLCGVILHDDHVRVELPFSALRPVQPDKKDRVKVILGEHRGELGKLITIDDLDGVVECKNNTGYKILKLRLIGKYTGSD